MYQNIFHLLNKYFFVNFFFAFIPISFILGNLILNLNILLFITLSLFIYYKDFLDLKFNFIDKVIFCFFFYILFVGVYNYFATNDVPPNDQIIIKSISYLRFLLLYFVVRLLIKKDQINFKIFFSACSICVLFVSLDVIFQFNFGKDIFGFEGNTRRLGGPFGDELIAGAYLQRFSYFLFFALLYFPSFKNTSLKINFFLFCLISLVIIFGLLYAGNRMPFVLFFITAFLIFIFDKTKRIYFFALMVLTISVLITSYNSNIEIKKHYGHFHTKVVNFFYSFSNDNLVVIDANEDLTFDEKNYTLSFNDKTYRMTSSHVKDFYSGYKTWLVNKYFGGGVKTFRFNCSKAFYNCNTHPHNYYLEILADLGIFGLLLIIFIFLYLILNLFLIKETIITPFIFIFIIEIFPLKSTGSFFTTSNATFIFLILSVIAGLSLRKN